MPVEHEHERFRELPRREIRGYAVPVATTFRSRLFGLAGLTRERAGFGLLIPRCASVHTFAMCFALDLFFLDGDERELAVHRAVPPRRLVWERGAAAVLEIPSPAGGEFGHVRDLGGNVAAPPGDRQRRRLRGRRSDAGAALRPPGG